MTPVDTLATAVGRGLLAGFAGTAAMTVSSTLEARIRGRAASSAPARATSTSPRRTTTSRRTRGCSPS